VDSNHRPHAYQACALNQLSYRPGSLIVSDAFHAKRFKEPSELGPWKPDSKHCLEYDLSHPFESPPESLAALGLTSGLVA
jgi:hypothetical protein